jgi:hypothetical protein
MINKKRNKKRPKNRSHTNQGACKSDLSLKILGCVTDLVSDVRESSSLAQMAAAVVGGVRKLGRVVLREMLHERDKPYRRQKVTVQCSGCKKTSKKRGSKLHEKKRYTLLGKISYNRCQYECSTCNKRFFPLDESLSLTASLRGHDDGFANSLVLLCTLMPFGKGCELFERCYGFAVSTHLARTISFMIGRQLYEMEMQRADELWRLRLEQPEIFEPPPAQLRSSKQLKRVYVMEDASKVGVQNGKRGRKAPKTKTLHKMALHAKGKAIKLAKRKKAKVEELQTLADEMSDLLQEQEGSWRDIRALLIFTEADLALVSKGRREILRRRVLGHVGTKEEWIQLVHMALHEEGVYTAKEVVIVADGGPGIWELFDDLLPTTPERRVIQILDWYHAVQKLWTVGRALKGHKTEAQRKACAQWVKALVDYLAEGKVSNVLQRLRKIKKASGDGNDALRKGIDYFETHRHRMHYKDFRNRKMCIGSGAMESIHAWVFQPRCRLPGMRWSVKGANAMIRLRCSWASERWDDDFATAANSPPLSPQKLRIAA